jgi:hypothetical protein
MHTHTKSSAGIATTGGSSVASSAVITTFESSNPGSLRLPSYSDTGLPNILILVVIFGIGMAETTALSFSFEVRSMMDEATLMSDNEIGKMFSVRKSHFVPEIEIQN